MPAGVEVLVWSGDPLGLLDRLTGVDRLLLIDAVVTGAPAGTIHRLRPEAPFATAPAASSHGLGLADALALGRALGRLPPHVDVWGVEGAVFDLGADLHEVVRRGVERVVDHLLVEKPWAPE
jgi:hydrogenase maturation protease